MTQLGIDPVNLLATTNAYLEHVARTAMAQLQQPQLFQHVAEILAPLSSDPAADVTASAAPPEPVQVLTTC